MAKPKIPSLPEINVDGGPIIEYAQLVVNVRTQIAQLETQEKELKKHISDEAEIHRQSELKKESIVGLVRVTKDDLPPIRIEFRQTNGALDPDQEPVLDKLFAGSRPELFEKASVVTEVHDPQALIDSLKKANMNPWDFLTLSVRDDSHRHVVKVAEGVSVQEAILPKVGLLSSLNGIFKTLSLEAKEFVTEYLNKTLKPSVVIGSRGKGK